MNIKEIEDSITGINKALGTLNETNAKIQSDMDEIKNTLSQKADVSAVNSSFSNMDVMAQLFSEVTGKEEAKDKLEQLIALIRTDNKVIFSPTKINIVPSLVSAFLDWNKIGNAAYYAVYVSEAGNENYRQAGTTNKTSFSLTNLEPDTEYAVFVRSASEDGVLSEITKKQNFKTINL